jgi:hypothetical protein
MNSGGSAIIEQGVVSTELPQTNTNALSRAGQSMEDVFLSTRKLGLIESRFKIPRHLTFREKRLLRQRAQQRKAQMDEDETKEQTLKDSFDDFEGRLKKVKKKATAITLKDVIAAQKPCDGKYTPLYKIMNDNVQKVLTSSILLDIHILIEPLTLAL